MNLFVYGTLRDASLLRRFVGDKLQLQDAVLCDFDKGGIHGEIYPAIIRKWRRRVTGKLVKNIPAFSWPLLDEYEGGLYRRQRVTVELLDGRQRAAQVYVLNSKFRHRWRREN